MAHWRACVERTFPSFSQAAEEGEIPDFQTSGPNKSRFLKIILFAFPVRIFNFMRRYGNN